MKGYSPAQIEELWDEYARRLRGTQFERLAGNLRQEFEHSLRRNPEVPPGVDDMEIEWSLWMHLGKDFKNLFRLKKNILPILENPDPITKRRQTRLSQEMARHVNLKFVPERDNPIFALDPDSGLMSLRIGPFVTFETGEVDNGDGFILTYTPPRPVPAPEDKPKATKRPKPVPAPEDAPKARKRS